MLSEETALEESDGSEYLPSESEIEEMEKGGMIRAINYDVHVIIGTNKI